MVAFSEPTWQLPRYLETMEEAGLTESFLPTLKDPPADAEAVSHKLMVRAGLIRQLGTGLWTYLPAGLRAHRKAI